MDLSPRAVISNVLNAHVTPLLKKNGFTKNGRTYYRERTGYQQLLNVQSHSANSRREGGSFTVNLGIFSSEVWEILDGKPLGEPAQEYHCAIRYRISQIGADGRALADVPRDEWWTFDHGTDLTALGESVAQTLQQRALRFFEHLDTPEAVIEEVHKGRPHTRPSLWLAAFATRAGRTDLGQRILDAHLDHSPFERRRAAQIARRVGLSFPAPVGEDQLIVTFQLLDGLSDKEKDSLYWQIVNDLRVGLPAKGPNYFDGVRFPDPPRLWEAHYYGEDVASIQAALDPLIAKLRPTFADITARVITNPDRRGLDLAHDGVDTNPREP